jgi:hypothetical protein
MKSVRMGAGLGFYCGSWRPVRASIESGGIQLIASGHRAERAIALRMEIKAPPDLLRPARS